MHEQQFSRRASGTRGEVTRCTLKAIERSRADDRVRQRAQRPSAARASPTEHQRQSLAVGAEGARAAPQPPRSTRHMKPGESMALGALSIVTTSKKRCRTTGSRRAA